MSIRKVPRILDGKYFNLVSVEENGKVLANCVACGQNKKPFSGSVTATSNFLKHLKRAHEQLYREYEASSEDPENVAKRQKQSVLPFPVTVVSQARSKSHRAILKFIVCTMSPLNLVENPFLKQMITALNPDAQVQCTETLRGQILQEFATMKKVLSEKMYVAKYIGATCDIWSARGRSFLSVTAHWIDSDLQRCSVVLALRRFSGTHSHDRIARLVNAIFTDYDIENKIASVTTDNGANFIKAFKTYGLVTLEDAKFEGMSDEEDTDDPELSYIEEMDFLVPQHFRCASHTLSLVATADLDNDFPSQTGNVQRSSNTRETPPPNPLSSTLFKKTMRSTFSKCCAFWNAVGRSTKVSEGVKSRIGCKVIRPVPTRWNSTFDSVEFLLKHKSKLGEIFGEADVRELDPIEIQFLEEYSTALKPLANALDTLQTEKEFYFGYYAPTILNLKNKLDAFVTGETKFASVIAWTLVESLKMSKRFGGLLNFDLPSVKTEVMAACTMPWFKIKWVPVEFRDQVKKLFIENVQEFQDLDESDTSHNLHSNENGQISVASKWDDMFPDESTVSSQETSSAEMNALQYLNSECKDITLLDSNPVIRKMFMKFNTPLPSSAPSERLFSYGGMILRPRRSRLTDDIFECLATLKLNEPHYTL